MPLTTFRVKGTYYYQAASEVSANRAVQGAVVKFQQDPSNKYDVNAVRVLLSANGAQLGHVPQVMSAFVSRQILAGCINKAYIHSVVKSSTYLEIKVTYEFDEPLEREQKSPKTLVPPPSLARIKLSLGPKRTPELPPLPSQTPKPRTHRNEETVRTSSDRSLKRGARKVRWGRVLLIVGGAFLLILVIFL